MEDNKRSLQEQIKELYRRAVEDNDANAQNDIACFLLAGKGVEKDVQKAMEFFRLAAEQGNKQAQSNLGFNYLFGQTIPRDPETAVKWLKLAADQGDVVSSSLLAGCYATGDGIIKDYGQAAKYWRYAADHGHIHSQAIIGQNMLTGAYGTPKNEAEGARWIIKAAEQGHAQAQNVLGVLYMDGIALKPDFEKAEKWLKLALEHGNKTAEQNLTILEKKRAMANNKVLRPAAVNNKLEQTFSFYEKAKKMIELNESELALSSIRNALESLVKQICHHASLDFDTREMTLEKMIDQLRDFGIATETEISLMHKIRKECNKGSHIDIDGRGVTVNDAKTALSYLENLMNGGTAARMLSGAGKAERIINQPMENPDYYSGNRIYWGKWAHCLSRNELAVIPEYIELEERAKKGDVEACLDIASGFLPFGKNRTSGINWVNGDMIGMPRDLMYRGQRCEYADFYLDARYYWWTMIATLCAGIAAMEKREFSLKYIATGIWDAVLYSYERAHWGPSGFLPNNTPGEPEDIAYEMTLEVLVSLGIDPSAFLSQFLFSREAHAAIAFINGERFIKDHSNEKLVAPVHSDGRRSAGAKLIYLAALVTAEYNRFFMETARPDRVYSEDMGLYLKYAAFTYLQANKTLAKSYRELGNNELITFEHLEFFLDDPFFKSYMDKSKERVARDIETALQMQRKEEEILRQEKAEPVIKQKKGFLSQLLGI